MRAEQADRFHIIDRRAAMVRIFVADENPLRACLVDVGIDRQISPNRKFGDAAQ